MNAKSEVFKIKGLGGVKKLSGSVEISGMKNAALPALAASPLFRGEVLYKKLPDIEDVSRSIEMLESLGLGVKRMGKKAIKVDSIGKIDTKLNKEISKRMRASILFVAPILAREGKVTFPHPGGCVIGERPIDLFLDGFGLMGAKSKFLRGEYTLIAPKSGLKGARIFFKNQSVTATETFIMAGVSAHGKTTIENAAMEPEVIHLANFLNKGGAKIEGAGTPTITIKGNGLLKSGITYITPPDRIEAGSFLILAALSAKNLKITNCVPSELSAIIERLRRAGAVIEVGNSSVVVKNKTFGKLKAVDIKTHEYPGFPTDLQAPMTVLLTQASGESRIFETIFEGRLNYTEDLIKMGADITVWNSREATIKGPRDLRAKALEGPDIRAGLAFIIAAIVAKGESKISNVYYIDRGYEKIDEKLRSIGVDIVRV